MRHFRAELVDRAFGVNSRLGWAVTARLGCWLLVLVPLPAAGHMVSISAGELRVEGERAYYELRMPLYEVEPMKDPQGTLFEHIHFRSSGEEGVRERLSCRADRAADLFTCEAVFSFASPVKTLEVECTYYAVTIPNHVHILRAALGSKVDQEIFDLTVPRGEINFVPPTWFEIFRREVAAGARRAAGGLASLLFLFAMVLAARGRGEFLALLGMFIAGEAATCVVLPVSGWQPAPRFVEAAAALTIAYLAVEILLLPQAGRRWLVVGVLGVFHGLYIALFIAGADYSAANVLLGVAVAEALLAGLFAVMFSRVRRLLAALRPVEVSAAGLLLFGLLWFLWRVKG